MTSADRYSSKDTFIEEYDTPEIPTQDPILQQIELIQRSLKLIQDEVIKDGERSSVIQEGDLIGDAKGIHMYLSDALHETKILKIFLDQRYGEVITSQFETEVIDSINELGKE